MKKLALCICILALSASPSFARAQDSEREHSLAHKLILYIPNRVLDVIDLVRAKLRIGPGLAVGVRATEPASVYLGSYVSVYAGLPGPRQRPTLPLPIGLESNTGVEVSVADAATGVGVGPNYSPTEIGASVHLLIIGADVDVDPMEFVDLLAGFILKDPRGDDL